jgi:ribonuclease E
VQVTKDPIGHKGARLTSQVSLPGRFLVYVPGGGMTGISRRLPDTERHRLKGILKKIVPEDAGVIVRTAAEGATEEDLTRDVERLKAEWESIEGKAKQTKSAPLLVHGEPELATRVVRDVFNEDFKSLLVQGDDAWSTISGYLGAVAPDLSERMSRHLKDGDLFHELRVDEQLMKALDRKVWLPSGGSLVIDRTEAMTVIDVNTGKFVGAGGNLEQTVTRNNLEAAEEIVRQLRLRDVGGIVVIDFIDMVLESNRELVLRRLTECLGRDRTKHQVAEVTSLGLVQMTRKRVGEGLLEAFSETCEVCKGRGVIIHTEPVDKAGGNSTKDDEERPAGRSSKRKRGGRAAAEAPPEPPVDPATEEQRRLAAEAIAAIHRAAAGERDDEGADLLDDPANGLADVEPLAAADLWAGTPEPEASELVVSAPEVEDAAEAEPAVDAAPPARRRRRGASRPAGPPGAA